MKRETWVLLVVLAVLAAVAWWIWKKPQGVTSVGPVLSATPAPAQSDQQVYPDGTPRPSTDVTALGSSAISTVMFTPPLTKGGLGVGGGGLLL